MQSRTKGYWATLTTVERWKWVVTGTVAGALTALMVLQLRGPPPDINTTTLALVALVIVVLLIPVAQSIGLPGGLSVAFTGVEAEKTVESVNRAAGGRIRAIGPSPATPKARELAQRFNQIPSDKRAVLGWTVVEIQYLLDSTRVQFQPRTIYAARALLSGCRSAIHSPSLALQAAERLTETGITVLAALESREGFALAD